MDKKEEAKVVEEFWEVHANPKFAHLCEDVRRIGFFNKTLGNLNELGEYMFKVCGEYIDFKGKTLIDYGIGGGFIGRDLFQFFDIGKYIGIDVSDRSVEKSEEVLSHWKDRTTFKKPPLDFSTLGGDVFISFACIQHFPSIRYLNEFLQNLNKSGISHLVLQIRYNADTEEKKNAYKRRRAMGKVCLTNEGYVTKRLNNYHLVNAYPDKCKRGEYQYLIYRQKKGEMDDNIA